MPTAEDDLPIATLRRIEHVCDTFEHHHDADSDIASHLDSFHGEERRRLIRELIAIDLEFREPPSPAR